jgi:predicted  nucleic acid-binding Zn-ribbon protein
MADNGSNYGMALLEMLQAGNKEARQAHNEAKAKQTAARRKLLEAQQESQAADAEVQETHQHLEATKTQVRTAIDSMSR